MSTPTDTQNDLHVQLTNDSSIVSKASTCEFNYFQDPYVKHYAVIPEGMENLHKYRVGPDAGKKTEATSKKQLNRKHNVSGSGKKKITRRAPLIHRGYAIRYVAVDLIVKKYIERLTLEGGASFQIVLLGAGFDTLYHRMCDLGQLTRCSNFIEVDFPQVVLRKEAIMGMHEEVFSNENTKKSETGYHLIGADLKDLDNVRTQLLNIKNFSFSDPTLVISEVVLAYLPTSLSDSVLKWVAASFPNATSVLYEQVCPDTSFGLKMMRHFKKRNSPLFPLLDYPTTACQPARGEKLGYEQTCAVTLFDLIYDNHTNLKFSEEWRKIEPFDEFEEWHLKLQHYMVWVGDTKSHDVALVTTGTGDLNRNKRRPVDVNAVEICKSSPADIRYGACLATHESTRIVAGGFGIGANSLHSRITTISHTPSGNHVADLSLALIFMSSASLSADVIFFGGRQGPLKPSGSLFKISPSDSNKTTQINNISSSPSPRWRHQLIATSDSKVMLVGGQSSAGIPLGDIWHGELSDEGCLWTESKSLLPTARHSFATVSLPGTDEVLVFGGLDKQEYLLPEVLSLNAISGEVVSLKPLPFGLYATRAVYCESLKSIILVGGITATTSSSNQNEIVLYQWSTESREYVGEYAVPLPTDTIFLSVNHQAYVDNNELVIMGGGGNCFSFGTHINDILVRINLRCL